MVIRKCRKQNIQQESTTILTIVAQIARHLMRSEGIYIKRKIQGMKVMFTVHTGAIRTVLSDRAFMRMYDPT